jgi:hypothetical protein
MAPFPAVTVVASVHSIQAVEEHLYTQYRYGADYV